MYMLVTLMCLIGQEPCDLKSALRVAPWHTYEQYADCAKTIDSRPDSDRVDGKVFRHDTCVQLVEVK
jgi:hypothetical protein